VDYGPSDIFPAIDSMCNDGRFEFAPKVTKEHRKEKTGPELSESPTVRGSYIMKTPKELDELSEILSSPATLVGNGH